MEISRNNAIEEVTLSEVLGLDTWNQERTSDQLQAFIERRHTALDELDADE